jgi:hypothetical protein
VRKHVAAMLAAGVVTALSPAVVQAAQVSAPEPAAGSPRVLSYAADGTVSEVNQPTFSRSATGLVVSDPSATLAAVAPCAPVDPHTVACPDNAPATRITQ